jgi:hypothetical protein
MLADERLNKGEKLRNISKAQTSFRSLITAHG